MVFQTGFHRSFWYSDVCEQVWRIDQNGQGFSLRASRLRVLFHNQKIVFAIAKKGLQSASYSAQVIAFSDCFNIWKIITADESGIYAYKAETKQQWVFEDEPNPSKVIRGRSTSKQIVAAFFVWRLFQWYTKISTEKFEERTREDESLFIHASNLVRRMDICQVSEKLHAL